MSDVPDEDAHNTSPDLAAVVMAECTRLKIPVTTPPAVSVTTSEAQRISNHVPFPTDLKFTTEVNMAGSKTAFQNLLSDFDDINFLGLWEAQCGHDPHDTTHPLGEVSLSPLLAEPETNTCLHKFEDSSS